MSTYPAKFYSSPKEAERDRRSCGRSIEEVRANTAAIFRLAEVMVEGLGRASAGLNEQPGKPKTEDQQ